MMVTLKKIFEDIDLDPHLPDQKPIGSKGFVGKMLKAVINMLPGVIKGIFSGHESVVKDYNVVADEVLKQAKALSKDDDFSYNAKQVSDLLSKTISTISVMFSGMIAQRNIKKMFKGEEIEKRL